MELLSRGGKVLIVDDEEGVRQLVQRLLLAAGYDAITAASGQEALRAVQQQDVEVVLLDIKMPGMSGMEVLEQLTAGWPDICVVMATAVHDTDTAVECMKKGAYDYAVKPFDRDNLVLKIAKAVERRNLRKQSEQYRINLEKKVKEQTEQVQVYFSELLDTLVREHNLMLRLSHEHSQGAKKPLSSLPPELRKPMASVEQYRDALLRILRRTG